MAEQIESRFELVDEDILTALAVVPDLHDFDAERVHSVVPVTADHKHLVQIQKF